MWDRRRARVGCRRRPGFAYFAKQCMSVQATDFSDAAVELLRRDARALELSERVTAALHDVRHPLPAADGRIGAVYPQRVLGMALAGTNPRRSGDRPRRRPTTASATHSRVLSQKFGERFRCSGACPGAESAVELPTQDSTASPRKCRGCNPAGLTGPVNRIRFRRIVRCVG